MIIKRFGYCAVALLVCLLAVPAQAEETGSAVSMEHRIGFGYLGVTVNDHAAKAREYDELRSSPLVNLDFMGNVGHNHLFIDGAYKGVNDYRVTGHVDLEGKFRLNLSSERLWHNLDHIDYLNRPDGSTNLGALRVTADDADPDAEYGLRLQFDEAEAIFKLGDSPAHARLKYWRQTKHGKKQLRFVEEGFDPDLTAPSACNNCHLQSKTRDVKRVTDELTAAVDAHVGYVDLVFEQMVRFFTVKDPVPADNFFGHNRFGPIAPTNFQHDEDPESRLLQSTVKARTSLAGGFVADAAYTYGFRDNRSELSRTTSGGLVPNGVDGVEADTTYQKLAGDISYTPVTDLTLNLRYRMLDIDTDNADVITTGDSLPATTTGTIYPVTGPPVSYNVRDSMDVNRYEVAAAATWRPSRQVTLKGEAQREVISRGSTGDTPMPSGTASAISRLGSYDPDWGLPEQETIDQYRLSLTVRPLGNQALKLNTWYRYGHSSDPAYGTSYKNRHEGFVGANYASKSYWGATAAARALRDDNDEVVHEGGLYKRAREQYSGDLGLWLTPASRLTTGINYGYQNSRIRQDVLFGADPLLIAPNASRYLMQSHNVSMYATLQLLKTLSLRADGYYLQSTSTFNPQPMSLTFGTGIIATTTDLTEISKVDLRQQGGSAGLDWEPSETWLVNLTYSMDVYDDRNDHVEDGSVQSLMASLACRW